MDKVCLYIVRDRASENHCFCFACPLCIIIYGRRYRALSPRMTRHRNSCFPQAIHLMNTTLNVKHTTLLYNYLFTTHTCFFLFQICTHQTCTHIIVYIIYCVIAIFYIAYLYIIILLSVSCCCHSIALWSFCHCNKFLVCVNIPDQ